MASSRPVASLQALRGAFHTYKLSELSHQPKTIVGIFPVALASRGELLVLVEQPRPDGAFERADLLESLPALRR
jgi:hypothetical protein